MSESTNDLKQAAERKGSFFGTLRAVAWSFFGVRRGADHAQDVSRLNPIHVVIAGVLGAVVFVVSIILLVNLIVGSGVAA